MISGIISADSVLSSGLHIEDVELPLRAAQAHGMLSEPERRLLFKLGNMWEGEGYVIDGGSFFGSSTVSLAEGMKTGAGRPSFEVRHGAERPLVAYDIGFLPAPPGAKKPITRQLGDIEYTWGESFVPVLEANVAGHEDICSLRIGDFNKEQWDTGNPIEICFVDLAKTNELNMSVFRKLFPSFVVGKTLLIQQDFFFDRLPWIKVLMGYLENYFEWIGQVGPSSVYRYIAKIPESMYAIDPFTDLPATDRIALHRRAEDSRLPIRRKFSLSLSLTYLLAEISGPEDALEHLKSVRGLYSELIEKQPGITSKIDRAQQSFERSLRLMERQVA